MEAGIKQIKASELFNFKQVNYINARQLKLTINKGKLVYHFEVF